MYYNQGEDQMFIPKKKPYNEACDSGHDIDQAEEAIEQKQQEKQRQEQKKQEQERRKQTQKQQD